MVKSNITITNESGLHLRPASELSKLSNQLTSSITIVYDEQYIDPKSILNLMSAGIVKGANIEVRCEGASEKEDLEKLLEAISSGFGE